MRGLPSTISVGTFPWDSGRGQFKATSPKGTGPETARGTWGLNWTGNIPFAGAAVGSVIPGYLDRDELWTGAGGKMTTRRFPWAVFPIRDREKMTGKWRPKINPSPGRGGGNSEELVAESGSLFRLRMMRVNWVVVSKNKSEVASKKKLHQRGKLGEGGDRLGEISQNETHPLGKRGSPSNGSTQN